MDMDTTRKGIIAGGNWIVDQIKLIEVYPQEERLANILRELTSNGGAPYNLLVTLHKMKADIPLEGIGVIGDDENGKLILEECKAMGIDSTQIRRISDSATSYTDVMTVQSTGRRTFFHFRGANALLNKNHFDFSQTRARIFHFGYLLLLDSMDRMDDNGLTDAAEVLKKARENGLLTSIDIVSEQSNRYRDIIPPALPYVDFLFLNEYEARMLTGISLVDEEGTVLVDRGYEAAKILLGMGVLQCVIIHFSTGAIAVDKNGEHWYQKGILLAPGDIKGTVGAGDAFAAGVLAGIHENQSMESCLVSGVCVAASSLRDVTSTGSIVSWKECLKLIDKYGWQS